MTRQLQIFSRPRIDFITVYISCWAFLDSATSLTTFLDGRFLGSNCFRRADGAILSTDQCTALLTPTLFKARLRYPILNIGRAHRAGLSH